MFVVPGYTRMKLAPLLLQQYTNQNHRTTTTYPVLKPALILKGIFSSKCKSNNLHGHKRKGQLRKATTLRSQRAKRASKNLLLCTLSLAVQGLGQQALRGIEISSTLRSHKWSQCKAPALYLGVLLTKPEQNLMVSLSIMTELYEFILNMKQPTRPVLWGAEATSLLLQPEERLEAKARIRCFPSVLQ